ncbi:MAG: ABC transporter permease [Coriobacteriia bacterium]|nr:ABC transporter permease [Coriobacteriia bacterium]
MRSSRAVVARHWATVAVLAAATLWMTFDTEGFSRLLSALVPEADVVMYPTKPLSQLMAEQVFIVAVASAVALVIGALLGALGLSRIGRPFRDVIVSVANLAQTIPSVAIMALAVPVIGYGAEPVVLALVLYSILPVTLNVIAGIEGVPADAHDAAIGMGMSARQRFISVEMPLAMPVMVGGVKNMLVINVSAATMGAIVAAGGLGMPILAGFKEYNDAFILEGALPAIALALLLDRLLTSPSELTAEPTA